MLIYREIYQNNKMSIGPKSIVIEGQSFLNVVFLNKLFVDEASLFFRHISYQPQDENHFSLSLLRIGDCLICLL